MKAKQPLQKRLTIAALMQTKTSIVTDFKLSATGFNLKHKNIS